MKRLNKEQKAKILRWEDVPLAANELKRFLINDPSKYIYIGYGSGLRSGLNIKGEKLKDFKKIVANAKESILFGPDIESDYLESMEIWADDIKDIKINESDESYMERIERYKKADFAKILHKRKVDTAKNKEKARLKEIGKDEEYHLYLKLKKKFGTKIINDAFRENY